MAGRGIEFHLLGVPRVTRDENEMPLPASRKTRALLCYLAATATSHRREHLCDLLWDGPNDPRAELRWSLSKIRSLFGQIGLDLSGADFPIKPRTIIVCYLVGLVVTMFAAYLPAYRATSVEPSHVLQ